MTIIIKFKTIIDFRKFLFNTFMTIIKIDFKNSQLNFQRIYNSLTAAMRNQIRWHCFDDAFNLFVWWNLIHPLIQWYNDYRMNKYIFGELDKRFVIYKNGDSHCKFWFVIDLTFESYLTSRFSSNAFEKLNQKFKIWAMTQIWFFLFVDHDFIFFTICYCYYFFLFALPHWFKFTSNTTQYLILICQKFQIC